MSTSTFDNIVNNSAKAAFLPDMKFLLFEKIYRYKSAKISQKILPHARVERWTNPCRFVKSLQNLFANCKEILFIIFLIFLEFHLLIRTNFLTVLILFQVL